MKANHGENLLRLLRAVIRNERCTLSEPDYTAILGLSQIHCVSNMLYYATPLLAPDQVPAQNLCRYMKEFTYATAAREAIQQKELNLIFAEFEKKRISVLPLKGCVIKQLYPKPDMRYMTDTDLLIGAEDAGSVRSILENLGYDVLRFDNGATDIYRSPEGMNYELHRDLSEEGFNKASCDFLKELHSRGRPGNDKNHMLELPPEEHYAYILCHFVKHFLDGGIGLRQVMDVYFCRKKWKFDEKKLARLLGKLELSEFAATLELLAENWFDDGAGNKVTQELGRYILESGAFGKEEQKVADRMLKEEKGKNKAAYIFSRLFPNFKTMSFYYPMLKKLPVLLPIFWVWRMLYALLFRRRKLGKEIATVNETDSSVLQERAAFYQRCGLKIYTNR